MGAHDICKARQRAVVALPTHAAGDARASGEVFCAIQRKAGKDARRRALPVERCAAGERGEPRRGITNLHLGSVFKAVVQLGAILGMSLLVSGPKSLDIRVHESMGVFGGDLFPHTSTTVPSSEVAGRRNHSFSASSSLASAP
eukprot:366399-Chlamydomonas_euryale.AAC.45